MDGSRFDALTRDLAGSRRSLLGAVLAGVTTLALGGRAGAALKRSPGDVCRKNSDCASALCGPKDATGRQRCLCQTESDCAGAGACAACDAGICVVATGMRDPEISVSFAPTGDSSFCSPIVSISGFAGCTTYSAEYWSARSSDGTINAQRNAILTLTTTDVSGASQTTAGSFFNQNRWLEFRITLPSGQIVSGWTAVSCPA